MQPGITDLFGAGATLDGSNNLLIPYTALQAAGGSGNPPTALEYYGGIVKNAHAWLEANTDASVMATSSLRITAPIQRNSTDRTQFTYSEVFYGDYSSPTFDPDQV